MSKDHLEVSARTLVRIVYVLGAVGILLGVIGLHAAYEKVGFHSTAGHIITTAIVVEVLFAAGVLFFGYRLATIRNQPPRLVRCPACGTTGAQPHEEDGEMCRALQQERFWKNYEYEGAGDE